MSCDHSELVNDLPMTALGDVLRPSMLGPSSDSGEERMKKNSLDPELPEKWPERTE